MNKYTIAEQKKWINPKRPFGLVNLVFEIVISVALFTCIMIV